MGHTITGLLDVYHEDQIPLSPDSTLLLELAPCKDSGIGVFYS